MPRLDKVIICPAKGAQDESVAMEGRFRWMRLELLDLWPGLVRLWRGLKSGLLIAVVFSVLLNATLFAWLAWPAMLPPGIKGLLLAISLGGWIGGWIDARRFRRRVQLAQHRDPQLDLFLSARREYLRSNWRQAEQLLTRLLLASPEDIEARLMLATLLRHEHRLDEAKEQLRRLQRWSRAATWNLEIRHEWERLSKLECSAEPLGERTCAQAKSTAPPESWESEAA
jgi:hypothetical protein